MEVITYKDKFNRKLERMFLWKSNTEGVQIPKRMELILHYNGSLCFDLISKKWVRGKWNGIVDDNNDYTTYIGYTLSSYPESRELTNHSQCVVCGNNSLYTTDADETLWYSQMLNDCDISLYYQLINSRNIPIITAGDDNIKREVERAFKKMKAGVPVCITTDIMSEANLLDIVDNATVDKLSTLDNFRDELIKRWCSSYGITIDTKEKKAQVNSQELESFGDHDTLSFLEMFEARLEFCKEMKENGIDIECIRNPIYWDEPTEEDIEDGEFEQMEGGMEDESNENSNGEGDLGEEKRDDSDSTTTDSESK